MTLDRVYWNHVRLYGGSYCYVRDRNCEEFVCVTKGTLECAVQQGVYGIGHQKVVSLHPFYSVRALENKQW